MSDKKYMNVALPSAKISKIDTANKEFDHVKIYTFGVGANRNYSYVSKAELDKALPSLNYLPVVGHLIEDYDAEGILQLCCVEDTVTPPKKFRNEKARKIYELIQSRKAEQAKNTKKVRKENPDTALPNLISAFCAFSPSYNLTNVWGLTIYQFYDQYHRLDSKIQLDVFGLRWAAWGKKDFDFSLWHKAPPKK